MGEVAEILTKEAAIGAAGEAVFGLGGKFLKYTFGQKALSKGPLGADDLRMADAMAGKGVTDSLTGKNTFLCVFDKGNNFLVLYPQIFKNDDSVEIIEKRLKILKMI